MLPDFFIRYSVIISWITLLFFSCRFQFFFLREEYSKNRLSLLFLALFIIAILYGTLTPAIRGGYDNNHDFFILSCSMGFFPDKEIAPVFIKVLIDYLSGFNIKAILLANSFLPALSFLFFYAFLRRFGIRLPYSLFASAIVFFNYNNFLTAHSLSTTSLIIFALSVSLCSFANALGRKHLEYGDLFWIFSSIYIVILSRCEHVLALFALSVLLFFKCLKRKDPVLKDYKCIAVLSCGILLAILFFLHELSYPVLNLFMYDNIFASFNMQIVEDNLALLFYSNPVAHFPYQRQVFSWPAFFLISIIVPMSVMFFKVERENMAGFATITAIFACFCLIYCWHDEYPLHFMRHRMFVMIPFAAMCGFLMQGTVEFAEKYCKFPVNNAVFVLMPVFALYYMLDVGLSHKLDTVLRTNDREWALIMDSWPRLQGKCAVHSARKSEKRPFFTYYLGKRHESECHLHYFSSDYLVFDNEKQEWDIPEGFFPVKTAVFRHSFYTTMHDENRNPVLVRPGFYRKKENVQIVRTGLRAILSGNVQEALNAADLLQHEGMYFDSHLLRFFAYSYNHDDKNARIEQEWIRSYPYCDYDDGMLDRIREGIYIDNSAFLKAVGKYVKSSNYILEKIADYCSKN